MALSLTGGGSIATDATFRGRVAMAFYFVARQVYTEGSGVDGHEERERFARSVTFQDANDFQKYAAMVVTDPTIVAATPASQAAVTDAQIIAAVTAMWNTLSNVPGS